MTTSGERPTPVDRRTEALLAAALCVPGVILVLGTAALLLGLLVGFDPIWAVEPLTLPEAAALRDNGEAVRLIRRGADPNAAGRVRARFVHANAQTLTPLEAAAGARRTDMMDVLLEHGAVIDGQAWTRLWCIAEALESEEVMEYLRARRPDAASDACDGMRTPWSN